MKRVRCSLEMQGNLQGNFPISLYLLYPLPIRSQLHARSFSLYSVFTCLCPAPLESHFSEHSESADQAKWPLRQHNPRSTLSRTKNLFATVAFNDSLNYRCKLLVQEKKSLLTVDLSSSSQKTDSPEAPRDCYYEGFCMLNNHK